MIDRMIPPHVSPEIIREAIETLWAPYRNRYVVDVMKASADEIERLRAENNLLQAAQGMLKAERDALRDDLYSVATHEDAQRYRWLRSRMDCVDVSRFKNRDDPNPVIDAEVDAAIDKARGK